VGAHRRQHGDHRHHQVRRRATRATSPRSTCPRRAKTSARGRRLRHRRERQGGLDIYAPVSGKIVKVNTRSATRPSISLTIRTTRAGWSRSRWRTRRARRPHGRRRYEAFVEEQKSNSPPCATSRTPTPTWLACSAWRGRLARELWRR
jgi:hypothetical protein